ncbi:hypothetical protein J2X36_004973 [Methylobacterium sp. BE186]|uniref:hypothetical protein n=1 Tax=Methylobacterium sp. BE186 TaxID=2817715 RepID=UPI0028679F24|nr:hypothetical protein [Methylobacterium sp. BE186]MDR7040192.1 hypothetical protein [Methylobacterium sp. BE186]
MRKRFFLASALAAGAILAGPRAASAAPVAPDPGLAVAAAGAIPAQFGYYYGPPRPYWRRRFYGPYGYYRPRPFYRPYGYDRPRPFYRPYGFYPY